MKDYARKQYTDLSLGARNIDLLVVCVLLWICFFVELFNA